MFGSKVIPPHEASRLTAQYRGVPGHGQNLTSSQAPPTVYLLGTDLSCSPVSGKKNARSQQNPSCAVSHSSLIPQRRGIPALCPDVQELSPPSEKPQSNLLVPFPPIPPLRRPALTHPNKGGTHSLVNFHKTSSTYNIPSFFFSLKARGCFRCFFKTR